MARHAGLLREYRDLGEILYHDAEEDVVRDLADARQLTLADIGNAGGRDGFEIRLHLLECRLWAGHDHGKLAGLDAFAVTADRGANKLAAQLLEPCPDRHRLLDP